TYPFGGRCSRWENARTNRKTATDDLDLVAVRNKMMFYDYGVPPHTGSNGEKPYIGMQGVFSVYSFYPLYSWFFHELGYAIKLSENVDVAGVQKCQSARCYPYEIAHGTFHDLINNGVKNIFVPHVVSMPRDEEDALSLSCPIAQAVPYYLSSAFDDEGINILNPVIDMSDGLESAEKAFADLAMSLGHQARDARRAFRKGCEMQRKFREASKEKGTKILQDIERNNKTAIVLVGRPYNAFARKANMGVPRKFASSGVTIIPCEFLPYENEICENTMYWKYGQLILKSLRFVRKHPNLFPVYISNFGCGPDSFIQHFSNTILKQKPLLYLELDSHTADAGIATRVAAFLDIISGYKKAGSRKDVRREFVPAEFVTKRKQAFVRTSKGKLVKISDPRVTVAFPSMGRYNTEAVAAASRKFGFNGVALPPADDRVLGLGKEFTSGKECSPAILTVGTLINYCRESFKKKRDDEILLFFMPTAEGPCRFGQYNVYMRMLIKLLEIEDVAFFSLTAENGYSGLGLSFVISSWLSVVVSNIMSDIRAALNIAAVNRHTASAKFEREWRRLIRAFSRGYSATRKALKRTAKNLSCLKLKNNPADIPKVLLAGEIFVRCDEISCREIHNHYADEGIMLKRADTMEWIYYTDWRLLHQLAGNDGYPSNFLSRRFFLRKLKAAVLHGNKNSRKFVKTRIKLFLEQFVERKVRRILSRTGLLTTRQHDIDHVVRRGADFIHPALTGEAILSAGSAYEVMEHSPLENYCGVVFIGPFNCMPTGVAESVIKPYARKKGIPYLTFETDAGPMPSNFKSQMEVHMLRAKRYALQQA
ncbi:acyl-CoA dehydratase activase-related protein, partial [Verrucomicrobiota bacterium]